MSKPSSVTAPSVDLGFGRSIVNIPLEPGISWELLQPKALENDSGLSPAEALAGLAEQLSGLPSAGVERARAQVVLVVPDETRPAPATGLVSGLLETLLAQGFHREHITLLIAAGTHRHSGTEELRSMWSLPDSYTVERHDCLQPTRRVGQTQRGTPVELNPLYLEANLRITMSAISLHYFAGFGGGPKMTFPGLASRSGVLHNHKLALAALPEGGLAAGCEPGRIVGNPVAEDLREAAGLAPPEVSIHWIRSGETDHYFLGNEGLAQGQQAIRRSAMAGQERAYDWVIASAGGHPYDIDLIQSHKALRHAARFVRPGGLVLLLAEGSNGAGSRSIETWLRIPELENLECRARDEYDLNAQTAISLRSLCRDYQVVWLSDPLRSLLESSGANAVSSREEIGEACRARVPVTDGMRGAVLPRASAVIPS